MTANERVRGIYKAMLDSYGKEHADDIILNILYREQKAGNMTYDETLEIYKELTGGRTMTNTERELRRRIAEAGFKPITVTMKCNGDEVTITPCVYTDEPVSADYDGDMSFKFDDVEFYLLDSTGANLCGRETLAEVAEVLLGYAERIREDDEDIEHLKAHIREYGMDSDWDFVSDFHKDLFGHRPHVGGDMLITWAHSDSKESARLYAERSNPLAPGTYAWGKEFYY